MTAMQAQPCCGSRAPDRASGAIHTRREEHHMIRRTLTIGTLVCAAASSVLLASALPASAGATEAREVELSDARSAPTRMAYLTPGQSRTYARGVEGWNCRGQGWFSNVQAYHWDGTALGPQRFSERRQITFWRSVRGRVTFDGITFRNRTSTPVLVAGWCE